MAVDFKALGKNDQVALVAGGLSVLLTFFPAFVKVSIKAKDGALGGALGSISSSASDNSWTEWATLGTLLIIAAFAIVVIRIFAASSLPDGVPWNLVTAAAAGLGTLILVLYVFTFGPDVPSVAGDAFKVSTGPGWSGWLLLISSIVFTVFAAIGFKESGEKIPEIGK